MRQYLVKVWMTLHGINHFQNCRLHERVGQYRCYLQINFSMIGNFIIYIFRDLRESHGFTVCFFLSIYYHDHNIKMEITIEISQLHEKHISVKATIKIWHILLFKFENKHYFDVHVIDNSNIILIESIGLGCTILWYLPYTNYPFHHNFHIELHIFLTMCFVL